MKRFAAIGSLLLLALSVLGISLLRSASVDCAFTGEVSKVNANENEGISIPYNFPYPGILPDSPFWPIKAFKDKVWVLVTTNQDKKAEYCFSWQTRDWQRQNSCLKKVKLRLVLRH